MKLIELTNIGKTYLDDGPKTVALSGATLSIDNGEFVAIVGPSGSGKSTLLHVLGFLDRPSEGTYRYASKTIDDLSDEQLAGIRNLKMGFVFQSFNLLARTSVLENVMLPLGYSKVPEKEWQRLATSALTNVGLEHRLSHEPSELSGGEKQRVAIARALVNDPDVIFADEPTGNLDSKSGGHVMDIFAGLNKLGKTVIVITHDPNIATRAERIISLKDGKIESDKKQ